jgi:hypothetical protein
MFATFPKNVDEKILTTVQKLLIETNKSQSAWVFGLEYIKWLFWVSWAL